MAKVARNRGNLGLWNKDYWVQINASVEERPEIKAKSEERIRNVPEANRERASPLVK